MRFKRVFYQRFSVDQVLNVYLLLWNKLNILSYIANIKKTYTNALSTFSFNTYPSVEIKCQLDATDDFYCRSYCLLNMFRAPLCPSSEARDYYTSGCCLSYLVLGFQVVGIVWSWGLCVRFAGCCAFISTY